MTATDAELSTVPEKTSTLAMIATLVTLFVFPPIGIILMWVFTRWSKVAKWLITILMVIVPIIILVASISFFNSLFTSYTQPTPESIPAIELTQLPNSLTIDAGAPLQCTMLATAKQIGEIWASYSCAAPGAYLESVDTVAMTAQYFTTNFEGSAVTYGPVTMPILEILP